jgi:hypothetical protein
MVAAIAGGSVMALGGLGLILVLLAQGRTTAVQIAWGVALLAGIVGLVLWGDGDMSRVVAGFVIAEATALIVMAGMLLRDRAEPV